MLIELGQRIGNFTVIGQAGNFVLSTQFSNGFHVVLKSIFFHCRNNKGLQDFPLNEVLIINVLRFHGLVDAAFSRRRLR